MKKNRDVKSVNQKPMSLMCLAKNHLRAINSSASSPSKNLIQFFSKVLVMLLNQLSPFQNHLLETILPNLWKLRVALLTLMTVIMKQAPEKAFPLSLRLKRARNLMSFSRTLTDVFFRIFIFAFIIFLIMNF